MKAAQDLFHELLDGDITPEDQQQLEAWLVEDQAHADEFMEWVALQSLTVEVLKGEYLQQVMQAGISFPRLMTPLLESSASPLVLQPKRSGFVLLLGKPVAIAAAALLCAFVARSIWLAFPTVPGGNKGAGVSSSKVASRLENEQEGGSNLLARESAIVATLTRLDDCIWKEPMRSLKCGAQLNGGSRIAIASGVARVTFESGATATLQGPCDFVIDNAMQGTILRGRVAVSAPRRAYGFRIRSPNSEVIDLGTEFGVAVDDDGQSEVHVFSGEVLSRQLRQGEERPGQLIRLKANHALKFASVDKRPSKIASDASLFPAGGAKPLIAVSGEVLPTGKHLALWLAADKSAMTNNDRRVFAWSDILHGDNVSEEDAMQSEVAAQPVLAPRGINGKPGVRFNGTSNYLVTTPLETTDDQTIFIVCQFSQRALRPGRKRGGQLLNYNGPPHRLVSRTYEPGVLQIGEPIVEGFAPTRLGGKLFAGRINNRDVSEAEMYSSALGSDKPAVLAYRYDLTNNIATLRINGELIEEKAALRPAGITSRKVIGRHGFMKFFFAGDIGELLIYNGALTPTEMKQVSEYLSKKYEIPLGAARDAI
jgi:hypothetical protein